MSEVKRRHAHRQRISAAKKVVKLMTDVTGTEILEDVVVLWDAEKGELSVVSLETREVLSRPVKLGGESRTRVEQHRASPR